MDLDDLLAPYRDDEDERVSPVRRRRSAMVRNAMPLSRFWSPSDALSRQPWFGFPGGREGWLAWKRTGEMPLQGDESQPRRLTPEQTDFYYRAPMPPDGDGASGPPPVIGGNPGIRIGGNQKTRGVDGPTRGGTVRW